MTILNHIKIQDYYEDTEMIAAVDHPNAVAATISWCLGEADFDCCADTGEAQNILICPDCGRILVESWTACPDCCGGNGQTETADSSVATKWNAAKEEWTDPWTLINSPHQDPDYNSVYSETSIQEECVVQGDTEIILEYIPLLDLVYPIGSIYITNNIDASPATLFGGQWELFPYERYMRGRANNQTLTSHSNNVYDLDHTHTTTHAHGLNSHTHTIKSHYHTMSHTHTYSDTHTHAAGNIVIPIVSSGTYFYAYNGNGDSDLSYTTNRWGKFTKDTSSGTGYTAVARTTGTSGASAATLSTNAMSTSNLTAKTLTATAPTNITNTTSVTLTAECDYDLKIICSPPYVTECIWKRVG